LKATWQRHVIAASGYSELGMFDDAALALEEIEPEDKTRKEVLGARVDLYMAAKKWDMAAAVASHLVKVEPEEAGWWINLAYATRRCESVEKAETILLKACELHHDNALIEYNLACYASIQAISRKRKRACSTRLSLIRRLGGWRSTIKILNRCGLGSVAWSSRFLSDCHTRAYFWRKAWDNCP
jgi:predicted Zn-dependent protease